MNYESFLIRLAGALDHLKREYFVTGGFAVSMWGRPRATFDVDIVINLKESDVPMFVKTMSEMGENVFVDEQMIIEEIRRGGEFNVIDPSGLKIDFFVMKDDAFSQIQNKRKRSAQIGDQIVFFVSPEDLVLSKLVWAKQSQSDKQKNDVQSIFEMMQGEMDLTYIRSWAKKLEVEDLLDTFNDQRKSR